MGVKVTPMAAIVDAFNQAAEILKEESMQELARLGEECIKRIREDHPGDWTDRTGNLRSSTGYAVMEYGREYFKSAFEAVGGGTEGSATGQQYVEEIAQKYADTYALVVVAGMSYAEHVESKGYDVISGAELWAKSVLEQRMKRAMSRAEKRINRIFNSL